MPPQNEKKTIQIGVKIPESLYQILEEVCQAEDRPVGYVARELMVRGLALYRVDGFLKDNNSAVNAVHNAIQKAIPPSKSKIVGTILPGKKKEPTKDDVRIMYQKESDIIDVGEVKPQRKKKAS